MYVYDIHMLFYSVSIESKDIYVLRQIKTPNYFD